MALNNNALFNAALLGFIEGAVGGAWITSATATDYATLKNAAVAFATEVDAQIAFDALITTNASNTMLVDTGSNTIQSNTIFRPGLMQAVCSAAMQGRYATSATATDYLNIAKACAALYTEMLLGIVSP